MRSFACVPIIENGSVDTNEIMSTQSTQYNVRGGTVDSVLDFSSDHCNDWPNDVPD